MQGWDLEWEDVQAIEQIRAEGALSNRRVEVSIRRGNHSDVNADGAAPANSLELTFLQDTKQRHLCVCGQLADFVEKQGTAIGELELALSTLQGSGKCASLVTEQFRGDERRRDRRAIHGHKRAGGTR